MEMENIAFIITGQLRTFFDNNDFINMINLTKTKYKLVHCIFILNPTSKNDVNQLNIFLNINSISHCIIDFSTLESEFKEKCKKKCEDPKMQKMVKIYYSTPKHAHQGISNPYEYSYNSTFIQYYQLYIGIKELQTYINSSGTKFDVVCKTRFDCKYPASFYPNINNKLYNTITQKVDENIDELIEFNKTHRLPLPFGHIPEMHAELSFGGRVCYNYTSLQNIKNNGFSNILYSFNDYFYFGNKCTFLKLLNLFDDCCFYEPKNPDLYNHYFCPESQFINYCLNNNIDIIMYSECLFGSLINR